MKTVTLALIVFGLLAGCSQTKSQAPSASPDQPHLYTTQKACEAAGRTWNGTAGTCM